MASPVFTFGPFRLEADERRLLRDSEVVSLSAPAEAAAGSFELVPEPHWALVVVR